MAFDSFVQIDGIEGESTDSKHSGWIEIATYSHHIIQKSSATASSVGGASAERADFGDFVFTKMVDKSSPKIAIACAAGTHINKVIVEICRAGGEKLNYMTYELTNCIISGYSAAGGSNVPAESVTINFGKINIIYTQQKRQGGGAAGNVPAGWDLQRNCKL